MQLATLACQACSRVSLVTIDCEITQTQVSPVSLINQPHLCVPSLTDSKSRLTGCAWLKKKRIIERNSVKKELVVRSMIA